MRLVLFDVDGTLVAQRRPTDGSYKSASRELIRKYFGLEVDPSKLNASGMTDRQALVEKIKSTGTEVDDDDPRIEAALEEWTSLTKEQIMRYGIDKIPGVEELVKRLLKEKGVAIGLLTSNTPERAKAKLAAVNLWRYFKIGAFGGATTVRSELVNIAIEEARSKMGIEVERRFVFIIGDTVRDIKCAREGGVRSIAVAVGEEDAETLKKARPDFFFWDFNDVETIVKTISGQA